MLRHRTLSFYVLKRVESESNKPNLFSHQLQMISPSSSSWIRGKFILFICFYFLLFDFVISVDDIHVNPDNKYQAQIDKLEQLLLNLTHLISRLESHLGSNAPKLRDQTPPPNTNDNMLGKDSMDGGSGSGSGSGFKVKNDGGSNRLKMGSVTRYNPFWSEQFQFMSAINLDSMATSVNLLPFKDFEGVTKYVAVGDDRGRVYVFLKNGDALLEFYTLSHSPVTCMLSYMSPFMNETLLVTGHTNGLLLLHRLWETPLSEDSTSLYMENLVALESGDIPSTASPISMLELHHIRRSRYILSVDLSGKMKVFRENGTLYGLAVPTSRPLAFVRQRLLFLMERGAGSLDLRTMKIRETECEGLNDSMVQNYVFDATERSKAYGFTSSGDLIHVLLLGDVMNFKCRVRSRKRFDMDEPLAFQAIKGYLLIIGQQKIFIYNVSTQHYIRSGAPRLTFSADVEEIKSSFLPNNIKGEDTQNEKAMPPFIASDREKLVILGLGGGTVGMYKSKLPIFKSESSTMLWTSPVLFFILFLFGAWHFFTKKKEALTSWGPDDPFSSTPATTGAPLGSGPGDRSFSTDSSSRNADMMDLRSHGLRGPPRRYTSPSRYPGGGGNSFRPNPVDASSRPSSVDPNYRASSELKFRGSNIDSTAFPKRRENMFVNSQVVDDGN